MLRKRLGLACTFVLMTLLSAPLGAAEKGHGGRLPVIAMRTGEHASFDRVVFDAPRGVRYKIGRKDGRVTVSFSIAAKITLSQPDLIRAKSFSIASGADGLSPLAVRFAVAPNTEIKDFMSDNSIVVDVMNAPAKAKEIAKVNAAKVAEPEKPEPAPKAHVKEKPEPKIAYPAETPSPVEKEEAEKAPETPAAPVASPAKVEEPAKAEPEPTHAQTKADTHLAPVPAAAPTPVVHKTTPPPYLPRPVPPAMAPKLAAKLLAIAQEKNPSPVLVLDPKILVGTAIFQRAGYVTILFDRKLSLPALSQGDEQRVKVQPFDLPRNTGYRFAIPKGVDVRATRDETAWKIYLTRAGVGPGVSTEFVSQPEFALGARLLLPTPDPPEPVFFTDPVVGDTLLAIPLRETAAFTMPRRLTDFLVIPAAQGLVIKPWHEKVVARIVPDGIEISSEGGLKLSPPFDTGISRDQIDKARAAGKVLFDFDRWGGLSGEQFSDTRQKLMQTIIDVPEDQRILARMDLARFYLAHGMGNEALALLSLIQEDLPEIETKADFLALRGAARVLSGKVAEGLADLSLPDFANQPEIALWQAIGAALERDWVVAAERFQISFPVLTTYPQPFRSRFMVLAVEAALASGKNKEASEWLSRLEHGNYPASAVAAIKYLRAAIYSQSGRADKAEKLWREVAKSKDRLYKIRAELALVDLGVATKSITPKQAVDRLEGLRFAWRGDDLEFDILRRLGGFYLEAKEFRTGLLVLGQALRLYPNSPQAPVLKAEMSRLFKDIFLTDLGTQLSPLEALGLYTDFKNLIPDGEEGNGVRRNLAERLVDIDLLDPAAVLLGDLIKNSDKPEERVKTATRLAAVRLLDHDAKAALTALDQSASEAATLSQAVQDERQLLRVRALSELGKYDEALAALPAQESESAKLLRADIAMRGKHWTDATQALMSLVGDPPPDRKALSEEKAGWLVSAALAMAQAGDVDGLNRLAEDYGAGIAPTTKADLFRLITRPERTTQMKDIAAARSRLSEVDMFKGFLDSYRKDTAVP